MHFDFVVSSTQKMDPGSKEEIFEDHMKFNNEEKYFSMSELFAFFLLSICLIVLRDVFW